MGKLIVEGYTVLVGSTTSGLELLTTQVPLKLSSISSGDYAKSFKFEKHLTSSSKLLSVFG